MPAGKKTRLPFMDSSTITAIVRAGVTTSADKAQAPNKQSTAASAGSRLISGSSVGSALANHLTSIRINTSIPAPILLSTGYWLLIDSDNMAWTTDDAFTSFRSVGVKFPTNAAQFGNNGTMECNWNGTYWFFFDNEGWGFYRSDASLSQWTLISEITQFAFHTTVAFTSNPLEVYISGQFIGMWKSSNGGLTFTQKTGANVRVNSRLVFDPLGDLLWSNGRLIASSPYSAGSIYTSDDDGATWVERTTASSSLNANTLVKIGSTIYSGRANGFYKSTDNGTSWSSFTAFTPGTSIVQDLKFTGSQYVATVIRTSGGNQIAGVGGPHWSPDIETTPLTVATTTDASNMVGSFNTFRRQIRYNGNVFAFYDRTNGKMYKSADGKIWSPVLHPNAGAGKKFWMGFPKVTDPNKNLL